MKSSSFLIYLILATALVSSYCASCEQLSTVFVLETSDSSSDSSPPGAVSNQNNKTPEDSNTRIVTDDVSPSSSATNVGKQQIDPHIVKAHHGPNPQHHQNNNHATQVQENKQREISAARQLEEESQLAAHNRQKVSTATRSTSQQQAVNNNLQRSKSTSTTSPHDRDDAYSSPPAGTTPKTEERLLISITSEEEEYRPPQKHQVTSGNGHNNDELQLPNHKRKPSITISIQDANLSKQNGGSGSSGTSAVILRPSENGQSIVISTVGLDSSHHSNNNKLNQKPGTAIVNSSGNNHNNNNEPHSNHHLQIHTSTTTYRPSLVNEYNPIGSNRPITPTLIDQPRPPIQLTEERPQRPLVGVDDISSNFESQRPTSRPAVRPTQVSTSYGSGNEEDELSRPINNNQQLESKYPLSEKNCGLVHETRIVGGEEADPDDFLWMAAIIKSKPRDGESRPFCGGSLITRRHILTAAHCLENLAPRDVLVRLGSYDFDDSTASSLSADFAIDQFRVPAQYSKKTHVADIAIMRLKTPLSTSDNYKTVCMPQPRRSYVGALGTVTGYGSQSQTFRRAAPKLRQVTVPIWENRKCSVVYKKNLTESFLCAGYEEGGKDACQGDSGGPIMTEGPNERMMIVGVVSHGIGCGSPGYPGVYTRTTTFLDWIEKNTKE